MKAFIYVHHQSLLLVSALLLLVSAVYQPTIKINRDVKSYMVLIDVTQSMNVKDMTVDGINVSRLDFAKRLVKDTLKELPCHSRVGLGIFFKADVAFLYNPIETCAHVTTLWDTLDHLEWRMASRGNSNIRLGLQAIAARLITADTPLNIVFLTDGDEAPPLNILTKSEISGWPNNASWLLVGIGRTKSSPIPKLDVNNHTKGYWSLYSVKSAPGVAVNEGPNSARDESYASAPYEYYLSKLEDSYLKEIASDINASYLQAPSSTRLAQAMQTQNTSFEDVATFAIHRLLVIGAILCILGLYGSEFASAIKSSFQTIKELFH